MSEENMTIMRRFLPPDLIEKAALLEMIGVSEYAWRWKDALQVVDHFIKNEKFVLGGDVYILEDEAFISTGDSWYMNLSHYIATREDLEKSRKTSFDYIEKYVKRNGEHFFFSIVVAFNR